MIVAVVPRRQIGRARGGAVAVLVVLFLQGHVRPRRIPPSAITVILEVAAPAHHPPRVAAFTVNVVVPPPTTADPQGVEVDPAPIVPAARAAHTRGARL